MTILAPEPTTWAQKLKSSDWWLGEAGAGYAALLGSIITFVLVYQQGRRQREAQVDFETWQREHAEAQRFDTLVERLMAVEDEWRRRYMEPYLEARRNLSPAARVSSRYKDELDERFDSEKMATEASVFQVLELFCFYFDKQLVRDPALIAYMNGAVTKWYGILGNGYSQRLADDSFYENFKRHAERIAREVNK